MSKVGAINYRKIKRISPSQFCSMKGCVYKSLLAEAFGKKPLLPISPNAYLGTVLHKLLEQISKNEIRSEEELNLKFDEEIRLMESTLKQEGYECFVPLQKNVWDFGVKKILLKKHLNPVIKESKQDNGAKFISEKWFESKDSLIGGRIDLVIEDGKGIEIVDFKTGAITQDVLDDNGETFAEIKKEYKEQLKLYAYLFYDCTNKFPTKLSLVDLARKKFNIDFSQEECRVIFEEAKGLLRYTNESIEISEFMANPNEQNCKYCLYRPACPFYLQYIKVNGFFNDVCGLVKNVVRYQNGNATVFIEQGGKTLSVIGFGRDKFEYFYSNLNKQINIFNLKKESNGLVYSVTKTTMIYD